MKDSTSEIPGSFRDPSGFLFLKNNVLYRQVNKIFGENYDHLMQSGLYQKLIEEGLLVEHKEVDLAYAESAAAYKVLEPEPIEFISYPYEWCFSQLKDAALTTLRIQRIAIEYEMSLKDASGYNIQFQNGRPIFIDTLSFEQLQMGKPWVAYRQYCQHFLAPLALMSFKDFRSNQLLKLHLDGIPLDLTAKLLPWFTRLIPGLFIHIHLHALSQKRFSTKTVRTEGKQLGKNAYLGILDSLESATKKMKFRSKKSEWAEYYEDSNYSTEAFAHKQQIMERLLTKTNSNEIWDLGANVGIFSRIASDREIKTVAFDIDPVAVEKNYQECVAKNEKNLLPLVLDLTNPSPAIGWENNERLSMMDRGPTQTVFALALIHHLAISNNLPFEKIAAFFRRLCQFLIVEFVPKSDSQIQRLLVTREDIFDRYTQPDFERVFSRNFTIHEAVPITDSERTIYLMEAKEGFDHQG